MSLQFDPSREGVPAVPPTAAAQGRPAELQGPQLPPEYAAKPKNPTQAEAADGRLVAREQVERSSPGGPRDPQPGTVVREIRLQDGGVLSYEWVRQLF